MQKCVRPGQMQKGNIRPLGRLLQCSWITCQMMRIFQHQHVLWLYPSCAAHFGRYGDVPHMGRHILFDLPTQGTNWLQEKTKTNKHPYESKEQDMIGFDFFSFTWSFSLLCFSLYRNIDTRSRDYTNWLARLV